MCSTKRSTRNLGRLVLLAFVAGVLGFSVPGCSFGGGNATLSPEAQAKAKENFKKRFANFGEKKKDRKTSRGNHSSITQRRAPP
jgi:hypothetical protein